MKFLCLVSLAAVASAAALQKKQFEEEPLQIRNFQASCTSGGCSYGFDISDPATHCSGTTGGGDTLQNLDEGRCDDASVKWGFHRYGLTGVILSIFGDSLDDFCLIMSNADTKGPTYTGPADFSIGLCDPEGDE